VLGKSLRVTSPSIRVPSPTRRRFQANANLGRLTVSMADGDGNGDYDRLDVFGARSFSIWTAAGALTLIATGERPEPSAVGLVQPFVSCIT